jgi:protein-disulfide isomerase
LFAATACSRPSDREAVVRLAARVDSLSATVTAIKAALGGNPLLAPPETVTVATTGAASRGSISAPVTVVEFTDYQCPFCARHARTTLPALLREFVDSGTVRYVIRDLPLPIHPLAARAAQAARCAGNQDSSGYWRYHDALFQAQAHLADSSLLGIARRLELDMPKFKACLKSPTIAALVQGDAAGAAKAGLTGTPSFVIGRGSGGEVRGVVVPGALPLAHFRQEIARALRRPSTVASAKP